MSKKTFELATFAGGCFWCMVKPFDELPGIQKVVSGYTGGHISNPTYEQVKSGTSGHLEVVQMTFDPSIFPYQKLLDLYWSQIDPTDDGGQFFDRAIHLIARQFSITTKPKKNSLRSQNNCLLLAVYLTSQS